MTAQAPIHSGYGERTTARQLDGIGGVYCEDADIATPVAAESTQGGGVRAWAMDPDAAERLWALSEGWTGLGLAA